MSITDSWLDFKKTAQEILDKQVSTNTGSSSVSERFNNYLRILNKMPIEEHSKFILKPYSLNKAAIFEDKSDKWLKDADLYIQFNEGSDKENPKFRIMMSAIYRYAIKQAEDARGDLKKIGELKTKINIADVFPCVKYADQLLYNYYKLIRAFLKLKLNSVPEGSGESIELGKDIAKLEEVINKYAKHLGVDKDKSAGVAAPTDPLGAMATMFSNGMDLNAMKPLYNQLTSQAMGVLKQNGSPVPQQIPQLEDVTGMFSNLLTSEPIKNLFGTVTNAMQNVDRSNPIEAFVNTVSKPEVLDSLKSVMATVMPAAINANDVAIAAPAAPVTTTTVTPVIDSDLIDLSVPTEASTADAGVAIFD